MQIRSQQWIEFKKQIVDIVDTVMHERNSIIFPDLSDNEFSVIVHGKTINPVFINKGEMYRVEYDFTLCNIKLRTLCFSLHTGALRIELTLKKQI